jgi:Fe-S-cluster containining protein
MTQHAPGWLIWPLLVKYYRWRGEKDGEKLTRNACRVCIPVTGGCCVFALYDGWKIFVFPAEAQRIAEYTGKDIPEFLDTSPLVEGQRANLAENAEEDPLWSRLFSIWPEPGGFKGRCPFVQKDGCPLPYHVKPFICQMFPLDFNITANTINFRNDLECLVPQVAGSKAKITACFGDHCDHLDERFQAFRNDFISLLDTLEKQAARGPKVI